MHDHDERQTPEQEARGVDRTIRLKHNTWLSLQTLAYGFAGDDLGTPDKVIAKLIADSDARFVLDALGCRTIKEAKRLVDLARIADYQPLVNLETGLECPPGTGIGATLAGAAKLEPLGNGRYRAPDGATWFPCTDSIWRKEQS